MVSKRGRIQTGIGLVATVIVTVWLTRIALPDVVEPETAAAIGSRLIEWRRLPEQLHLDAADSGARRGVEHAAFHRLRRSARHPKD